ncbi:hypothetical protein ACFL1U_02325 [Patescibacteria group bacterium]
MGENKTLTCFRFSQIFVLVWINVVGIVVLWLMCTFLTALDLSYPNYFHNENIVGVVMVSILLTVAGRVTHYEGHVKQYGLIANWAALNFILVIVWGFFSVQQDLKNVAFEWQIVFALLMVIWFSITSHNLAYRLNIRVSSVVVPLVIVSVVSRFLIFMPLRSPLEFRDSLLAIFTVSTMTMLAFGALKMQRESLYVPPVSQDDEACLSEENQKSP